MATHTEACNGNSPTHEPDYTGNPVLTLVIAKCTKTKYYMLDEHMLLKRSVELPTTAHSRVIVLSRWVCYRRQMPAARAVNPERIPDQHGCSCLARSCNSSSRLRIFAASSFFKQTATW